MGSDYSITTTNCDYRLLKSGRFGYDKKYIDELIKGLGPSYSVAL